MADITSLLFARHLRGEQSAHILHYKEGRLAKSGRGLSFWFLPLSSSIADVPVDDRDQAFLFHGRSKDHQEIVVQGVATYRVADPEKAASRVDFTIDLRTGAWRKTPLDTLSLQLTQLAQQLAESVTARHTLRELVESGVDRVREALDQGLRGDAGLQDIGLAVVSVRISAVQASAELERALQMPTREALQQESDLATFQRRALAVENERAIAENELKNRIELARREEELIGQQGTNARRRATEEAEQARIATQAEAERRLLDADALARSTALVEGAKVEAERLRMEIHKDLPPSVMMGLAAQELARNLTSIEHLNLGPDALGPLLQSLITAGTKRLEAEG